MRAGQIGTAGDKIIGERVFMTDAWYASGYFWTLAGTVAAALLLLAIGLIWLRVTRMRRRVARTLRNIADRLMRDIAIPDGIGGFVPVDAIVLRDRRLYVLDIRDLEGAIFGAEKMDIWTAMGRKRYQFNNPLRPMHDRVTAVKLLAPGIEVLPRILFTSRGHFPKGRPTGVQLLEEFAQPLLRDKKTAATSLDDDLQKLWEQLCQAAGVPPGKERPLPRT